MATKNKKNTKSTQVSKGDPVNSPDHYTIGGIETIEILRAKLTPVEFIGCCKGQILQYIIRAPHKGQELEDYEKALWWLKELVTFVNIEEEIRIALSKQK